MHVDPRVRDNRTHLQWHRTKSAFFAVSVALTMTFMTGCSEQERREIRQQEAQIEAEKARQWRIAEQYRIETAAETARRKNVLNAETKRQLNENLTLLGQIAAFLAAISGVIGFLIYCIRRLGEKHVEERTKRHHQNLKALEADPHLRPEDRRDLYRAAIEVANKGGTPLLGYQGNTGGVS